MSFNQLTYDPATYKRMLQESVSILDYVFDGARYENPSKCRHELGLVGGPTVSHIEGNLVDLESDLRGQTRYLAQCASRQYQPPADGLIRNDKTAPIDTRPRHLRSCQMFSYQSVPLPTSYARAVPFPSL
jgi:hypothetical protein